MKKRLNIVLLGPPGSGKGVQAELLEKELRLKKISVGDILRREIKRNTKIGRRIKYIINKGKLIDSKLAVEIVKTHIGRKKLGLLFDGFPRELEEAKELDKIIYVTHVFLINVPEMLIIRRLSKRYECYCGRTYNLISKKPKHDLKCDECGRKLYRREDDRPELIKRRIAIYKKETLPVVRYYQSKVFKIDGSKNIKSVYNMIKRDLR